MLNKCEILTSISLNMEIAKQRSKSKIIPSTRPHHPASQDTQSSSLSLLGCVPRCCLPVCIPALSVKSPKEGGEVEKLLLHCALLNMWKETVQPL